MDAQGKLNFSHQELSCLIESYINGLIMTTEFLEKSAKLQAKMPTTEQCKGCMDMNTGLRYE